MDEINELARAHNLIVIEDAAHAHGASYRGRACGSLADLGSFSFQLSKNMTAGEGGIITTNNAAYAELGETLVWGGRKKGQPWYCHFMLASNARMTEFQGAILSAQLARLPQQVQQREANGRLLDELLSQIEGIRPLATLPSTTRHAYHIYMFRYSPQAFGGLPKARFVQALQAEGIEGAFAGYIWPLYRNPVFVEKNFMGGSYPVNASVYGRDLDYGDFVELCPVSEHACTSEAIWLPQSALLADANAMEDVARAIRKIQANVRELSMRFTYPTA
jgi:dTDP-4-amino-4,6-dideoxygalactose transaminase